MSLDQARRFLAKVLPWPQEGEPQAWVNLHWTVLREGEVKPYWTGRAARDLEGLMRHLEWGLTLPDTRDVYCCMSTQRDAQEKTSKKNTTYFTPVRLAEGAIALKSLFIDLDAKGADKNSYATLEDAVVALGTFLKATGLPKPSVLVSSGGGLHVHWTLDRALTVSDWYPLAVALVEATKQYGLKCDTGVTTDAARVLRVPNTWNCKTDPKRPVRIVGKPTDYDYPVELIDKILTPYKVMGATPAHLTSIYGNALTQRTPIKVTSGLSQGIDTAMPRAEIAACLDAIPNTAKDFNEWNAVAMQVYAAAEGADYGLEEWQRWSDTNASANGHEEGCIARWDTLHNSPPTRTGAGALITRARTALGDPKWTPRVLVPLALAAMVVTSAVTAPTPGAPVLSANLPMGYSQDPAGIISKVGLDGDGNTIITPVCEYPMTDAWLNSNEPRELHFTTITERGKVQHINMPLEIQGTQEQRRVLQAQGFMLDSNPKIFTEFILGWIKTLQAGSDSVNVKPFGWSVDNGKVKGFVYDQKLFAPGGTTVAGTADRVLQRQYTPVGDIAHWRDAVELITSQGRADIQVIVASAFAAPLVFLSGHDGLLLSTWSQESGIGKSTALNTAQAVWGSPVHAKQGLNDTANSLFMKMGQTQSLPLYWDEIKGEDATKNFVSITFQATSGRDKSRLTQSAKLRESGSWKTMLVAASNDSLLDYVTSRTSTTTAGLYRVFEFEVTRGVTGQIDPSTAARLLAKLDHNFGGAGLIYAKFLGENYERIDKEVAEFQTALGAEMSVQTDERLWQGMIGCICLGARYANELGLGTFDEVAIKAFMMKTLVHMRAERKGQTVDMKDEMNVSNTLANFLNSTRQRHTIVTNRIHIKAGKPAVGSIKISSDVNKLDGIYVHVGVEDKLLRVSSTFLSEWLTDKGVSRHIFTKALMDQFGCKKVHGRIASGTQYAGATEYLLEIDLAGSPLADFVGEA